MLTVEVPDTAAISKLGQEGLEDIEEPPDWNKHQIEGGVLRHGRDVCST